MVSYKRPIDYWAEGGVIIELYTDDGELGLTVGGSDLGAAINEVYYRLLQADPEGPLRPVPPHTVDAFKAWCYEQLDGATASIKGHEGPADRTPSGP